MTKITPKGYRARIADTQIQRYLRLFGALEISGTKWCGKTWSSLAHANSVTYVDRGGNLAISQADPSYPLTGESPHVIDEWQRVPQIWDTVRHAVDELGETRGQWILTGSSTPRTQEVSHNGAGRIGRIRMHPMTLLESSESSGASSLASLFDRVFQASQCPSAIGPISEACCRGGWPTHIGTPSEDALLVTHAYLEAIFEQSIPSLGGDPTIARRLCESLARNLGQATTIATLARDVFAHGPESKVTDYESTEISQHLKLLAQIYLIDEVPGWVPASRSPKRMRTKPKRYFADPSVPVALLGLTKDSLLQDWQTFGLVFENLCMRDLDVYTRALNNVAAHPVRYYRDDSGLEVDAILELPDGRWGGIEVKLSADKVDEAAENLLRMKRKLTKDPAARTREPSFLAVVTGTGEASYQRPDGVCVLPVRTLGI